MTEKMIEGKRIALIPAYEPDEKLIRVAAELFQEGFEVIVVNDGSSDATWEVFARTRYFAKVLTHPENRGKGAALKTGLAYIQREFALPYTVVTVDADGQHQTADVLRVTEAAEGGDSQVSGNGQRGLILGSRRFTGNVPLRSRFGNSITRLVYRMSSGAKVYDTQTGLRAFAGEMIPELLSIPGERYEYEMNMLLTLAKEKRPIKEVWIETVYLEKNASSHFDTVKDSARIYKEILKFSGASLISFLVDYVLYCILLGISGTLVFANIGARIVSGTVNYTLNRKMVFKSQTAVGKSALQYILLAAGILVCNTLLLEGLIRIGANAFLAKILVEVLMFSVSYVIQHAVIFKRNTAEKQSLIAEGGEGA